MTGFYTFVKQESIPFPEKPFDPGGRPATEKEQGVRYKQMHMKPAFDDGAASESIPKRRSVYPQTI